VISFADKQKYDFVFDESGKNTNQISFFIYLKDATDITSEMLKELNDSAPEGAGH
jgi:Skp family chaperone for outer membrane proteins